MDRKSYIARYEDLIINILKVDEKARDDKQRCYAHVLHHQVKKYNSLHPEQYIMKWQDMVQFIGGTRYKAKQYCPSFESVSRGWRKVLEDHPELRGPGYKVRHRKMEPEVRQEARDMKKGPNLAGEQIQLL